MRQKSVICLLILLLINSADSCHSSCAACGTGTTKSDCIVCDSTMFLDTNSQCLGIPGSTTLLEIIDHTWDNSVSRYLYSMKYEGNVVYNAAALSWTPTTPISLHLWGNPRELSLYFNGLPTNLYRLQVRASVSLNKNAGGCIYNFMSITFAQGDQFVQVDMFQQAIVTDLDEPNNYLAWITYEFSYDNANICDHITFNDFTIIGFQCPPTCLTCSNATNCLTCAIFAPNQYYLSNGACIPSCPISYFDDPSGGLYICDTCDISCSRCLVATTNCTVCNTGFGYIWAYAISNSCVNFCPVGQYIDSPKSSCWSCSAHCLTCINSTACLTCAKIGSTQYYLSSGACVQYCALSYYDDPSNGFYICDGCDISCSKCLASAIICTTCNTSLGYVWAYNISNSCANFCPDGQYINYTASSCLLCSTACLTCITKPTHCLSCGTSLGGQLYLNGTTCLFNCPTATYSNNTLFACKTCDVSCATCNGPSSSNCLTCATVTVGSTTTIYYLAIGASSCATTCPDGQFINSNIPNYCQQCSSLCVLCQGSANICTSCPTGFYFSGNTCLSTCNAGTYADTTTMQCLTCNSACSTCFGVGTSSCYTCKTDTNTGSVYYLSLGTTKCVTLCPSGQIAGSNNLCVACAPQCATCSLITTNCTKCLTISGVTVVYLQNSNCVQTCATGTYPQTATSGNLCLSCDPSCSSCFGPLSTTCTACTTYLAIVYYKDPAIPTCSTNCPSGYFGASASNTCSQCQAGCSSCQINSTYCQGCQNVGSIPYYLINNLCLNVCPNGYYPNGNLCSACHISCASCTGPSSSECSSCNNATVSGVFTQFYLAIRTTTCSQFCPPGQYIDAGFPNSCQQCSSLCVYCFGNSNNCTNGSCTYGYFFYINTCISVCFSGTYGNSTSWQCLSCHAACATCFGGDTASCYSCRTDNVTNTVQYLQLGTTICSNSCPVGQITGTANLCLACASQCAACSILQTNCTTCSVLNGASVYLQGGTCTPTCTAGSYAKNGTTNNLCLACNAVCSTCYGPSTSDCYSCRNATTAGVTTVYFKDAANPICSTSCPLGYVGIASSNACQQCQAGCVTCQTTTTNCQQCQLVGNTYYYFYNNSCLMICPDGTYKNNSDLTCNNCSYFTLNQQCIQQCPTGYMGITKGSASVCEGCSTANCTSYNEPFNIKTTVIGSSKNFMHEVRLSVGLNQNCTVQSLSHGLQVSLFIKSRRLLITLVPLNVLDVSISPDYSTVNIITDSQPVDISKTSVDIQFRAGALITPSGILYTSLGSSIALQNPAFVASYYQAYGKDMVDQIQGIVLIILSTFLLLISLCLGSEETVNEMLMLVQSVQMVGLMRTRTFPIVLSAYNMLQGFSYLELQYIPNPLTYFIPGFSPQEVAQDAVKLTYGSQNMVSNFAPLLFLAFLLLLVEAIVYAAYKANEIKAASVGLLIRATIEYFLFIILYGCLLALASLQSNVLTNSNILYISSIGLSLIILISCLAYFAKHAKVIAQKQFYKITHFLRIVCLIVLAYRFDIAVICFNSLELVTIIIEISRCAEAAANPFLRFVERLSMLVIINICLFIVEPRTLILGVGSVFALIGFIKLYHLFKTIYKYLQREEPQNILDAKSQALKLQQNPSNASQNFIYEETICQKKMTHQEKSLDQINQMRETAISANFPKHSHPHIHPQPDAIINDFHLRELMKDSEEIGARRKRKFKKVEEKIEEKISSNLDEFDNVEIIKVEPKLAMQQPQDSNTYQPFEPEIVSENSDNLEIISIH